MKQINNPLVVAVDRLGASLVISFEDGRCALFSSELLYAILPQAVELHETDQTEGSELLPPFSGGDLHSEE